MDFSTLYKKYTDFLSEGDKRSNGMLFMSSPLQIGYVLLVYFAFVYIGPKVMKNRPPFELKLALQFYNFAMVMLSGYLVYEEFRLQWFRGVRLVGCELPDLSETPTGIAILNASWWFMVAKLIELLDTVFIILRKKFKQVSFLHVFHHGFLPFNWWFGVKFAPGGFGSFHATVNVMIHVVMYSYYLLASFGPSMQKYLWWKKYITKLQISQFIIVSIHTMQVFFWSEDCTYPKWCAYMILGYELIFLVLFINFYVKTYNKKTVKAHANGKKRE